MQHNNTNRNSASKAINLRIQTQQTTTQTMTQTQQTTSATTLILSEEFYKKCLNKEKLCFGLPDGCIQSKSCTILSSSFPDISNVTFELLAPIESNRQNYYIAHSVSKISVNIFEIMKNFD